MLRLTTRVNTTMLQTEEAWRRVKRSYYKQIGEGVILFTTFVVETALDQTRERDDDKSWSGQFLAS